MDVAEKSYLPFGAPASEMVSGYGYRGEAYDTFTGSLNLRARHYEPELQRFSQKDILAGDPTKPLTLNRYLYVVNDSINYEDPSGQSIAALFKKAATTIKNVVTQATQKVNTKQNASIVTSAVLGGIGKTVSGSKEVQNQVSKAVKSSGIRTGVSTLGKAFTGIVQLGKSSPFSKVINKVINACTTAIKKMDKQRDLINRSEAVVGNPDVLIGLVEALTMAFGVIGAGLPAVAGAVATGILLNKVISGEGSVEHYESRQFYNEETAVTEVIWYKYYYNPATGRNELQPVGPEDAYYYKAERIDAWGNRTPLHNTNSAQANSGSSSPQNNGDDKDKGDGGAESDKKKK